MVYELLDTGKENALEGECLRSVLGFKTIRALRQQVHNERLAGYMICSSHDGETKGYYKPANEQEHLEFIRMMKSSADSIYEAIGRIRPI